MTPQEEQELHRLLQVDSANMPSSMAVNQEQLASAASVDKLPARSIFYGVYTNTGNNADKFKYRAAVRLGSGEKARFMNLGYFNCETTAALAYNVAAINTFGAGAWLNRVDKSLADATELARFHELRSKHISTAASKVADLTAKGIDLQYVDLADREASIQNAAS